MTLADGSSIEADLLVVGIGVTPDTTIAEAAGAGADEVQHHARAPTTREALHLLRGLGVGLERLVRAVLLGEVELVLPDVQRDDPGRGELTQELQGDVPETARADDDSGRSATKRGGTLLIAWYGVSAASVRDAARTGSRSPIGTRWRGVSTTMNSAIAPLVPSPGEIIPFRHRFSDPSAHISHTPQPQHPYSITACPTSTPVAPSPSSSTTPAGSCPNVIGIG